MRSIHCIIIKYTMLSINWFHFILFFFSFRSAEIILIVWGFHKPHFSLMPSFHQVAGQHAWPYLNWSGRPLLKRNVLLSSEFTTPTLTDKSQLISHIIDFQPLTFTLSIQFNYWLIISQLNHLIKYDFDHVPPHQETITQTSWQDPVSERVFTSGMLPIVLSTLHTIWALKPLEYDCGWHWET